MANQTATEAKTVLDSSRYVYLPTRMYTIKLGSDAEASVHVHRWIMDGKRMVSLGITSHTIPWRGHNDVNVSVDMRTAIRHLFEWRANGYTIERFVIPAVKQS